MAGSRVWSERRKKQNKVNKGRGSRVWSDILSFYCLKKKRKKKKEIEHKAGGLAEKKGRRIGRSKEEERG